MLQRATSRFSRHGITLPFIAILMVVILGMAAFAVDIGYLAVARSESQNAADAAALAGMSKLAEQLRRAEIKQGLPVQTEEHLMLARQEAKALALSNRVDSQNADLQDADIEIGYMADPSDQSNSTLETSGWPARPYNAVRVTVRRDQNHSGGSVKLFFASVLGVKQANVSASATAAFAMGSITPRGNHDAVRGGLLPFAYQVDEWNALLAASAPGTVTAANGASITITDSFAVDPQKVGTSAVSSGADNRLETSMFPETSSAGNFGTINFSKTMTSNTTSDLESLIVNGPNEQDWPDLPEILSATVSNPVDINGETGLSGSMEDAMSAIIGEPHIILLYSTVSGSGNDAYYRIVGFAPVTIVGVDLFGANKCIKIQPHVHLDNGALTDSSTIKFDTTTGLSPNSLFIGSRALVR